MITNYKTTVSGLQTCDNHGRFQPARLLVSAAERERLRRGDEVSARSIPIAPALSLTDRSWRKKFVEISIV